MAFSLIDACTFNAYTGAFQILAFGNMWRRFKPISLRTRLIPFLVVMIAGMIVAMVGYKNFVTNLSNFLDVLLVIFIPWSAVNLTDYFVIRRGHYDVESFFVPNSIYGKVAWRGLLAYAVGLGAEWPFVSQPDYVGPLVAKLGGADISWIVGWVVAAALYLVLMRTSSASERVRTQAVGASPGSEMA
jgi:nucleobase:cation symporter-1, NCS1 family